MYRELAKRFVPTLILCLLALATASLSETPAADPEAEPDADRDAEVRTGTLTTPDGVSLVYEIRGDASGEAPTLVFVHCWACDRSVWRYQVDALAEDHRVVTLDLAGHGESGAGREAWTLEGLAGDVAFLVESLELGEVILVGHSMGGPVAVLATPRLGEAVQGIVCVDTLHDLHQEFPPEQAEAMVAGFEEDFPAAVENMTRATLPQDVDPALVQGVIDRAVAADRAAVIGLMRDFARVDLAAAAQEVDVPIRCVQAKLVEERFHTEGVEERNREVADWHAVAIEGVGHFLLLEDPEVVNVAMREAIAEIEETGVTEP